MIPSLVLAAVCLPPVADAPADALTVGSPAPKIEAKEFIKGAPLSQFEKGKIYVVEFWATWCGPCVKTIPHLTELQKKHPDVTFLGVAVEEENPAEVKKFVEKMGEKMAYRVALDAENKGDGDKKTTGKMAAAWLEASLQTGIPAAFVVNGEGKIAWICHPSDLEEPLKQILAGKWDLAAKAAEYNKAAAAERKLIFYQQNILKALEAGDVAQVEKLVAEATATDAELEKEFGMMKLTAYLSRGGDADKALAYATHLVEKLCPDDCYALHAVARAVCPDEDMIKEMPEKARPQKPNDKLKQLALRAAERAVKLGEKEEVGAKTMLSMTLADVCFENDKFDKAFETADRVKALVQGTPLAKDPEIVEWLKKYDKAKEKRKPGEK